MPITTVPMLSMIVWIALGVIYFTLLLSVALGMLFGFRKGLYASLIRLGITLVSGVLAFIGARLLFLFCADPLIDFLLPFLELPSELVELVTSGGATSATIDILLSAVLLPVVFCALFCVLEMIATIVYAITTRKLAREKRPGGLGIGAVRGLAVAVALLLPLMGYFSIVDAALNDHPEIESTIREEVGEEPLELFNEISNKNVLYLATRGNVVRWTMQGLTKSYFDSYSATVYDAVEDLGDVAEEAAPLLEMELDLSDLSDDQLEIVDLVLLEIDKSDLLAGILSDIVTPAAGAWADGESFLDVPSPITIEAADGKVGDILTCIFGILESCDRETVADDLHTLLRAAIVLTEVANESGESGDDLIATICQKGRIDRLISPFSQNSHMKPVIKEIMGLGVWALAQSVHADLGDEEAYEEVLGTLSNIVTDAEMSTEKVSEELNTLMKDNNIEVSEELVESFSEVLVSKVEEVGPDLTVEDMEEILAEFVEVYADEIAEAFPDGIPDNFGEITLPGGGSIGDITLPDGGSIGDIVGTTDKNGEE